MGRDHLQRVREVGCIIHTLGTRRWQVEFWQETDLLAETRRLLEES